MIRWFRMRLRPVALPVLWVLVALAGLSASPHEIECTDEAGAVVAHDANGHAIGPVRTSDDPLHCVLCHWSRAFSADGVRAARIPDATETRAALIALPVGAIRAAPRLNLPPRAPPV